MVVHPAVAQARRVVGLYGDPTVTWSIALETEWTESLTSVEVTQRVRDLWLRWPHLGPVPEVDLVAHSQWHSRRREFLDTPYGDDGPLVRVALGDGGHRLVVAAHHGAVDGLGLVGLVGRLVDTPITASARGVSAASQPDRFWRRSLERLWEALVRPPARLGPMKRRGDDDGDWTQVLALPELRGGTSGLVAAVIRSGREWRGDSRRRGVISLALSTRPGHPQPAPDRATAYGRIVVSGGEQGEVAAKLRELVPEPVFPQTTAGGVGPLVTSLLSSRLGATALVSNIGRLSGEGLVDAALWPAASGPAGVAVGAVTVGDRSTVTVRMRRGWFLEDETREYADILTRQLAARS